MFLELCRLVVKDSGNRKGNIVKEVKKLERELLVFECMN